MVLPGQEKRRNGVANEMLTAWSRTETAGTFFDTFIRNNFSVVGELTKETARRFNGAQSRK